MSILCSALFYPRWNQGGSEATISWDTAGYYYYLPAFFIYQDAKKLEFKDEITKKYKPSGSFYQAFQHEASGNYVMKYSIGQAVMYTPFFLLGHAYASFSDTYPADGFSKPYQRAIHWGSLFIALIGLWYCRKNLLEYFDEWSTAFALLFIVIGSNYLNYAAFDSAMTHNWLFSVYAVLIWQIINWYKKASYARAINIGLLIGIAALTRPPEIIALFLALFWGMTVNWTGIKERFLYLKNHFGQLVVAAILVGLVGSIQIIYWLYVSGEPFVYSYEDQGFDWDKPHWKDVLISYRSGWLTYSPLMVFALVGLVNLIRQKKQLWFAILLFSLVNYYIVCSWSIWWYGGSFGMRALIQSYPIWIFPLAAFLNWMLKMNWRKLLFLPLLFLFCAVNIFFTRGPIDAEYMNKTYYWHALFNFDIQPQDRLLLDTNEGFFGTAENVRKIYSNSINPTEIDSTLIHFRNSEKTNACLFADAGLRKSAVLSIPRAKITGKHWIRMGAKFKMPEQEFFYWTMPQFNAHFIKKDGQVHKERFIRCPRALEQGKWKELWIDTKIPIEDFDRLELFLTQPYGHKRLLADDFFVEVFD